MHRLLKTEQYSTLLDGYNLGVGEKVTLFIGILRVKIEK